MNTEFILHSRFHTQWHFGSVVRRKEREGRKRVKCVTYERGHGRNHPSSDTYHKITSHPHTISLFCNLYTRTQNQEVHSHAQIHTLRQQSPVHGADAIFPPFLALLFSYSLPLSLSETLPSLSIAHTHSLTLGCICSHHLFIYIRAHFPILGK